MLNKLFSTGFVCWFALSQALLGVSTAYAQSDLIDVEPPLIEHDIVISTEADVRQSFFANVVDDDKLDSVSLYYRFQGDPTYNVVLMKRVSYSSTYIAHVPTSISDDRDMEYYIQARDQAGNRTVRGYAFNPLKRQIVVPATEPAESVAEPVIEKAAADTGKSKTILYVVLGVLAAGAIAGAASKKTSTPNPDPDPSGCPEGICTISVTVGAP